MSLLHSNNVIGMIEGLAHQTEPHGVNAREHNSSLRSAPASCSEHALAFTPAAVHQNFTSGALIEKRANGKVAEVWRKWLKVRDGKPWEGAHPSRAICGRSSKVKPGSHPPRAYAWHR